MGGSEGGGGKRLDCFLPGMIALDGVKGKYPAVSITGGRCELLCLHCKGHLLGPMIPAPTPSELLRLLKGLEEKGMKGALISGGCDRDGRMPWDRFLPALKDLSTSLFLSCHAGMNLDKGVASALRSSSISQVLIDVVGDRETLEGMYRLSDFKIMERTIHNAFTYGPQVVPHIVVGVNRGWIKGEYRALQMLEPYRPEMVVLVVLMPHILGVPPPSIEEVVDIFRQAKATFPQVVLGCARPRGRYRYLLEERLIEEGLLDRLSIWSDEAIQKAEEEGYEIRYHLTCCSLPLGDELDVMKPNLNKRRKGYNEPL